MRVSADRDDPGYTPDSARVRVFFNGTEVRNVITADEERRTIWQYAVDENGRLRVLPTGEGLQIDVRMGDVRIEFNDAGAM